MSKIYVINGANRTHVDTLVSGTYQDSLNTDRNISLTLRGDAALDINGGTLIEYEGEYFDVLHTDRYMLGRIPAVDVSAEGVLSRLTGIKHVSGGAFSRSGTPAQLIGWVLGKTSIMGGTLSETPFSFGATDVPGGSYNVQFNYGIGEKYTRREMLQTVVDRLGGEIEIVGWDINVWSHRGQTTPIDLFGSFEVSHFAVNRNYLETREAYDIALRGKADINVGDELHIVFPPLQVDIYTRVIALEYNPYNHRETTVYVGDYRPDVGDLFLPGAGVVASQSSVNALRDSVDTLGDGVDNLDTRVTGAEESITTNSDAITAETNRATGAEGALASAITQNANSISLVVSEGSIKAASIVAAINAAGSSVKVEADHVDINGIVTIGSLAKTNQIPTSVSALANDAGYQNATGVVTIIDGRITADYVEALGIKVAAANVTGKLVIGQLPSSVAQQSDIPYVPSVVSELSNDAGYKDYAGVTTVIDGYVDADFINARDVVAKRLHVTHGGKTIFSANANTGSVVISPSTLEVSVSGNVTYVDLGDIKTSIVRFTDPFVALNYIGAFNNTSKLEVYGANGLKLSVGANKGIEVSGKHVLLDATTIIVDGALYLNSTYTNVANTLANFNSRITSLEGGCGSCDSGQSCGSCDNGDCTSCDTSCDTCQSEQTPDYDYYVGDTFAVYYDKSGSYYLDLDGFEVIYEDSDHDELECVREGWCSYQVMLSGDPYGALVELYIGPDPDP